jgi:hypothetical protein
MIESSVIRLEYLLDIVPDLLKKIGEEEFSYKSTPDKWSKKEILGHLIDSATNNHHRFIRVQFEDIPKISYDQNKWNSSGYYNKINSNQIISFWTVYNRQLLEIMQFLPEDILNRKCNIGEDENVTLAWIINDYIRHMEHHLKQLVEYK